MSIVQKKLKKQIERQQMLNLKDSSSDCIEIDASLLGINRSILLFGSAIYTVCIDFWALLRKFPFHIMFF